ncbi:MAG TPA: hypothetical protein VE666_09195 [Mycobacterium sp.]|jgi:hypothetical protein|nr:hypothetical protein [Mycobacterium sp.]
MVDAAITRGEIPADVDAAAVVDMLLAMFLEMGFYAGFIVDQPDMAVIAKQLRRLIAHGLLNRQHNGRALTIAPTPAAVTPAVDAVPDAWAGLPG